MKKRKNNKNSSIFLEEEINQAEAELNEDINQSIDIVNRNREELDNQRQDRINGKFERNAGGMMLVKPKARYSIKLKNILIAMVVIIILVFAVIYFGPYFNINITEKNYDLESNKVELVTKESDIYGMYDEDFYVFSNNSITVYNSKCEVVWNHIFTEGFVPSITTNGNYMLVTNDSTGTMYLFENRKEILNKKIDGKIKNTFLDKYGNMAIEYTVDSSHTDLISVFNKNGEEKLNFYHNNIVSMEMLNDASKIVFMQTNTDSSTIGTKFEIIDISKKEDERLREITTLNNQFVYNFKVNGKYIYALTDDKIISINVDNGNIQELKKFESAQMLFVALNDKYYTYLERDIENGNYKIENINYNNTVVSTTVLDSVPKSMASSNYINYYIYQEHIYIQNKWGVELKQRDIGFTPKQSVIFNNCKSIALIYTNKIYILNI